MDFKFLDKLHPKLKMVLLGVVAFILGILVGRGGC